MTPLAASSITKPRADDIRKSDVAILGIGAATPPAIPQEQLLQSITQMAPLTPDQNAWLNRVFRHSGIDQRGTVLARDAEHPLDSVRAFYPNATNPADHGPTTAARMARYAVEAPLLARAAAQRALADSQLAPQSITHLITVSCTGFYAPGLDASLIEHLPLSPSVRRLHIGFMGCHGAFNALAAARDMVRADPRAKVLVCCVELCSLHLAYGWDPGKLVANALFGDGAAAVVISRPAKNRPAPWRLRDTASFLLPDSAAAMTWRIGDHGFEMTLDQTVPILIRKHLGDWCRNWLARHDLEITDIAGWAIHPGGPKILSAVAHALSLPDDALRHSRKVLADHGNMSSGTVLFILQQMAEAAGGPCVAIGLGPGLMAEGMLLAR